MAAWNDVDERDDKLERERIFDETVAYLEHGQKRRRRLQRGRLPPFRFLAKRS